MSGIAMLLLSGGTTVRLTDHSIIDNSFRVTPDNASAGSFFELGSDGVARFLRTEESDGSYVSEWMLGGSSSDYEVRFTLLTGAASGTFDTWLALSFSRTVSVTATQSGFGTTTSDATVRAEIRTVGGVVLSSSVITLSATAQVDT